MKVFEKAFDWATHYAFTQEQVDYATILQLKILDKKCQMSDEDQELFSHVYEGMKKQVVYDLNSEIHSLIQSASQDLETFKERIKEERISYERSMDRPTMKAYKAMVRHALSL